MDDLKYEDIFENNHYQIKKLMEDLDETFPPFYPLPTNSMNDIMFRSGQRSVIDYLKDKLEP